MSINNIRKRDGRTMPFDREKIENAIFRAFQASGSAKGHETAEALTDRVIQELENNESISGTPTVEQVQDTVERVLIEKGFVRSAKAYILYRAERSRVREMNTRLMRTFEDITFKDAIDSDIKRENANINGDTAMGSMLKFGSEGAKQFYDMYVLDPRFAQAHREGDIHIHDLDFYTLTTTCCQIELTTLFKDGFSTGHGYLREPQDITSYAALCCIAIQANQNDQHGGQSIVDFDYGMAPGVKKTFIKRYRMNLARALELLVGDTDAEQHARAMMDEAAAQGLAPQLEEDEAHRAAMKEALLPEVKDEALAERILDFAQRHAAEETDKATYQAMEALVHNLNTMNSRAGAQVPFSSINYGMDTSAEGRMVMKNLLHATEAGLGGGETPIFPIQIFRVKEGVNFNPG
ncbi:MAG: anaerobic ribonucleoside-triphosphate reductase, partial [Aristaeellaceae bacterium]